MGFVVVLAAQQAPAKGTAAPPKLDKAQQAEIIALLKVVNQVETGSVAPSDMPMSLSPGFLKSGNNRIYVPYSVSIDLSKLKTTSLAAYLRIVKKGAEKEMPPAEKPMSVDMVWVNLDTLIFFRMSDPMFGRGKSSKFMTLEEAQQAGARNAKADEKAFIPDPVFEDPYFIDIKSAVVGQRFHFERAFMLPAGDYDVYLAMKERVTGKNIAKTTVLQQAITIPNFFTNDLTTSTVFLANKVDQLPAPLTEQQLAIKPFTIGLLQFMPSFDARFTKKDNLDIVFLVYNAGLDASQKPDLEVDYNFYQKPADGPEKYFNKTDTLVYNEQTLPKDFDGVKYQILVPQELPPGVFADGTWRLEIRITDKILKKVLTRNVTFTVAG